MGVKSLCVIFKRKMELLTHEKCPYSELFWSAFSRIRSEYGEILRSSAFSHIRTRITPNTDTFHAVTYSSVYWWWNIGVFFTQEPELMNQHKWWPSVVVRNKNFKSKFRIDILHFMLLIVIYMVMIILNAKN